MQSKRAGPKTYTTNVPVTAAQEGAARSLWTKSTNRIILKRKSATFNTIYTMAFVSIANDKCCYGSDTAKCYKQFPLNPPVWVRWMTETLCLLPKPTMAIECLCFDQKACDVHIDDGGNLVCRHGSNEGVVDGIAKVICPLEIDSERIKWEKFLARERNENAQKKTITRK